MAVLTISRRSATGGGGPPDIPGFSLVLNENFDEGALASRWAIYDSALGNGTSSTFGSPTRIQSYKAANVSVGAGSAGATDGTSLKMTVVETDAGSGTLPTAGSAGTRYSYTAGMLDSKTAGIYYPRYGWYEWRAKLPHGQGLWPALWLTAKNGGAGEVELDLVEYFHVQAPGRNRLTIHSTDNGGTLHTNKYTDNTSGPFFEEPTYTPGWHTWAGEIVPVTDSTGTTVADPTQPNTNVRVRGFLDGAQYVQFVDTTALHWTTNGGDADQFFNVYIQGTQVDGNWIGHPRSPLGYDHWRDTCIISGTAPNSCATSFNGHTAQTPQFGDPASVTEIDYFRVYKFTG